MDAFEVLADPTRRRLLELLADRERTAGELVEEFQISQPSVSRHLRLLREAGLVEVRQDGTRRVYRLESGPLGDVLGWLLSHEQFWRDRLELLERNVSKREGD